MPLSPDLPIAGYYRLSRESQAKPEALASHRFQIRKAIEHLGGEYDERWVFSDVMSGRKNNRPEFMKVRQLIATRAVKAVVVRLDRMSRDGEMFFKLSKLFEKTGVQLFELLRWREIDFSNPDDWADYHRSGIDAEKESRVISRRSKLQREYARSEGKVQGGRMPFGFVRSTEGRYEINPEQQQVALEMARIYCEESGAIVVANRRVGDELGIRMTYQNLRRWLQSPVLRGHTPYLYKDHSAARIEPTEILYNTHSPLLPADVLSEVDLLLGNRQRRSPRRYRNVLPLSGLLRCGRCGGGIHLCGAKDMHRAYCISHRQGGDCGGRIEGKGITAGKLGKLGTPYPLIDAAVVEALERRSAEVIAIAEANAQSMEMVAPTDTPEMMALKQQITRYEAMAKDDADMLPVLAKKRSQLQALQAQQEGTQQSDHQLMQQFIAVHHARIFSNATVQEKVILYREFVDFVEVDGRNVRVKLRV